MGLFNKKTWYPAPNPLTPVSDAALNDLEDRIAAVAPTWSIWSPTFNGWSSAPASGVYRYVQVGKTVTLMITQPNDGTSNGTSMTISLPITAANLAGSNLWTAAARCRDNGGFVATPCLARAGQNATVLTFEKDWQGTGWTASGGKRVDSVVFVYEVD